MSTWDVIEAVFAFIGAWFVVSIVAVTIYTIIKRGAS